MKIVWSDLAFEDLNDIEDYIARDNPTRAVSFSRCSKAMTSCEWNC